MTVILRPTQSEWIGGISRSYAAGHRRVLGVAVTGFGKTVCFVDIARRTVDRGGEVTIIAHRIEIVQQIAAALARAGVRFGWIMAGRPYSSEPVQVGMVATVANRISALRQPRLLVIDEAHHATAGSYQKIARAWERCFILGVTASPQRTDGTGLGQCFDTMVLGPSMGEMIARGYLAGFAYFAPRPVADLSGIKTRGGDYATDELAAAMDRASITGDAIGHYAKHLAGRPAIAFCASVEHANHVAEQFTAVGWKAASVDGSTDHMVRADRIAAIGDGRLNVLTSCDIISEGTDIPAVAGAILLRPTKSLIIFLQQCGRVLRAKADGSKAIILDHVGSVLEHGMPDDDREWSLDGRAKRRAAVSVAQCPKCYAAHRPAPRCPACGHVYAAAPTAARRPQEREGVLEQVDGASLPHFNGEKLQAALREARRKPTDAERRAALDEIRIAMGYKRGWTFAQMAMLQKFRRRPAAGARAA